MRRGLRGQSRHSHRILSCINPSRRRVMPPMPAPTHRGGARDHLLRAVLVVILDGLGREVRRRHHKARALVHTNGSRRAGAGLRWIVSRTTTIAANPRELLPENDFQILSTEFPCHGGT